MIYYVYNKTRNRRDEREHTNIFNGFKIVKERELDIEIYSKDLKGKDLYLIEKYNIPIKEFNNEKYIDDCNRKYI